MKTLLVISCVFLAATIVRGITDETLDKFVEAVKDDFAACAAENGVSEDELKNFNKPNLEGEDRKKMGCFKYCMMTKMGAVEDGKVNAEGFKDVLEKVYPDEPDTVTAQMEVFTKCAGEIKETAECDIGYEFGECFIMNSKE